MPLTSVTSSLYTHPLGSVGQQYFNSIFLIFLDGLGQLIDLLGTMEMQHRHHLIWVGDFNHHHSCWDLMDNNSLFTKKAMEKAEILIQVVAEIGLDLVLLAGTPTHEHNITKCWLRLDQVFITEHMLEMMTQCEALPVEQGLNTDHFPIITNLNINVELTSKEEISNFRDVNWKEFREILEGKVST